MTAGISAQSGKSVTSHEQAEPGYRISTASLIDTSLFNDGFKVALDQLFFLDDYFHSKWIQVFEPDIKPEVEIKSVDLGEKSREDQLQQFDIDKILNDEATTDSD